MKYSRNKLLYLGLAAIAACFGGDFLWRVYVEGPLEQKRTLKTQTEEQLKKKKKDLAKAKAAIKKLEIWEESSLPSDPEIARSLYRTWLLELVEKSEFQKANVDSGPATSRKGYYEALAFSVRGKGTLQHVVRFLFDFYRAGHLHRIQQLSLTPLGKSGLLDVIITVEALILPGTDRTDKLSTLSSHRLHHDSLADYGIIAQRNIFGVGGESDPAHQAFLTAVTQDEGEPEIWITIRGKDKLLKLQIGSEFEIGRFNGTIIDILDGDVIFESGDERWLLSVGEPLSDAIALPPEF